MCRNQLAVGKLSGPRMTLGFFSRPVTSAHAWHSGITLHSIIYHGMIHHKRIKALGVQQITVSLNCMYILVDFWCHASLMNYRVGCTIGGASRNGRPRSDLSRRTFRRCSISTAGRGSAWNASSSVVLTPTTYKKERGRKRKLKACMAPFECSVRGGFGYQTQKVGFGDSSSLV